MVQKYFNPHWYRAQQSHRRLTDGSCHKTNANRLKTDVGERKRVTHADRAAVLALTTGDKVQKVTRWTTDLP